MEQSYTEIMGNKQLQRIRSQIRQSNTHTLNVFHNFHPVRPTLGHLPSQGLANSAPCCTRFASSSNSYTHTCTIWSGVNRAAKGHTLQLNAENCLYVTACHDVDIRKYAPTPILTISTTERLVSRVLLQYHGESAEVTLVQLLRNFM